MAELNMDCVRDLLLFLEENQRYYSDGRIVSIKMKNVLHEMMKTCSYEHLFEAAKYLGLQKLVIYEKNWETKSPRWFVCKGITPKGHALIAAMKDENIWNRAKKHFPSFIDKGADCLIQLLVAVASQKIG